MNTNTNTNTDTKATDEVSAEQVLQDFVTSYKIKEKKCYQCKYRENVVGSAHSKCTCFKDIPSLEILMLNACLMGDTNPSNLVVKSEESSIPVQNWDKFGLQKGYVLFPSNFDPVWLDYCLLFQPKQEVENDK